MPLSSAAALRKDKRAAGSAVFQHRHYAEIARMLLAYGFNRTDEAYYPVVLHFADQLADANPNFDRKRFLAACS